MCVLLSLWLTLNRFHTFFYSFYCWLWTSKCLMVFLFTYSVEVALMSLLWTFSRNVLINYKTLFSTMLFSSFFFFFFWEHMVDLYIRFYTHDKADIVRLFPSGNLVIKIKLTFKNEILKVFKITNIQWINVCSKSAVKINKIRLLILVILTYC